MFSAHNAGVNSVRAVHFAPVRQADSRNRKTRDLRRECRRNQFLRQDQLERRFCIFAFSRFRVCHLAFRIFERWPSSLDIAHTVDASSIISGACHSQLPPGLFRPDALCHTGPLGKTDNFGNVTEISAYGDFPDGWHNRQAAPRNPASECPHSQQSCYVPSRPVHAQQNVYSRNFL